MFGVLDWWSFTGRGRAWRFDFIRQSSLRKQPKFCDAIPGFAVMLDIWESSAEIPY